MVDVTTGTAPPPTGPGSDTPPPTGATVASRREALFPYLGTAGWRPLLLLCLLSASTVGPLTVLVLHRPELRLDLGLSAAALDRAAGLALSGLLLAAFVASLCATRANAAVVLRAGALVSGTLAIVTAGVNDASWLRVLTFAVVVFAGIPLSLLRAYAYDVYGPAGGWRVPAALWAAAGAGVFVVGVIERVWNFPNWGVELALFGLGSVLGAVLLSSAGSRTASAGHGPGPAPQHGELAPQHGELAPLAVLSATAGLAVGAAAPTMLDLLTRSWGLGPAAIGGLVALTGLAVASLCGFGHWYHHLATRPPSHLTGTAGAAMLVAGLLLAGGAASDTFVGIILAWAGAGTAVALAAVCADAALLPPGPARPRHYRGAALTAAGLAGAAGIVLGPWMVDQVGRTWTLVAAAAPAALIGWMVMLAYPSERRVPAEPALTSADVPVDGTAPFVAVAHHAAGTNGTNGASAGAHTLAAATAATVAPTTTALPATNGSRPRRVELLQCRGVDAGYEGVQVLFGVDLTVTEGQIVALMGTNGAGKTTLLRTVSGLLGPTRGSITFGGVDVTGFDPTWRVKLGMNQIAGGESLAPGLTVAENLRMFSYSLGRKHGRAHAGIDAALAQFPRLAERRNQPASTLSGGEKQMLALAKAFVLRPRLLVIDEFSLGLAPKIVGELLPVVSQINVSGTSVLLVEQSVNVALSIAHHAYCMEKGEIVYDGSAASLREEPDLLRSVYLEGISRAVAP